MELVSIGTFNEKTIKASLTIEKELIYPSFNSNYESHIVKLIATFLPNELQMVSSSLSTFLALN